MSEIAAIMMRDFEVEILKTAEYAMSQYQMTELPRDEKCKHDWRYMGVQDDGHGWRCAKCKETGPKPKTE